MKQASTSKSIGTANWAIGNASYHNRLAEDIAMLQDGFEKLPLSPEITNAGQQKDKGPAQRNRDSGLVDSRGLPPHFDPCLPFTRSVVPTPQQAAPPRQADPSPQVLCNAQLAKEVRDFEEAEFHLRQSKLVGSTISLANSQFRAANILKPDGLNFGNWYQNLAKVSRVHLKAARFFFKECDNSTYEKISRAVMIASVDHSLVAELQTYQTCHEMYNTLVTKFKTPLRAAQMNIFNKFRAFKVDPEGHNAGIALTLRNLHTEWTLINVTFGINSFLGFVLQSAVMDSSAEYKKAFELRVKQLVQNDKKGWCPTFDLIMTALDICKDQHKHAVEFAGMASTAFTSPHPPASLMASTQLDNHFDVLAFLADIDEREWVDALDFYALTAHKCWQHHLWLSTKWPPARLATLPTDKLQAKLSPAITEPATFQESGGPLPPKVLAGNKPANRAAQQQAPASSAASQGGVLAHVVEVNALPNDPDSLDFHSMALGEDLLQAEPAQQSLGWVP
ncbi:hypothetical protein PTTG_05482 [Puccinia triticina 1-1 BBBD Race 1]|uniref:Uncharacterized protein n=1 Tax=Puccinia triticina (isolate 1-1 / race 1 (BBBD)) TaxID=630390 RepID=A0A180G312_PUCT1|nr:hypothetical protein PTTG_05482 [Puccinia triticina 1-1 BBBD Race 1]